jgi:ParB/RepB/Spo0J family partition protein
MTSTINPDARIVPLNAIQIAEGANPRRHFDEGKLAELAESIRTHGILQPLVVYADQANGGYVLIAGERRHRAARLAGLTTVPVIVRDEGEETIELATDENLHRQDLNAIEEAAAFQAILESGKLTWAKLAERVSKSGQYVSERLRLLDLPVPVQEAIAAGSIPVRLGKLFAKIAKVSEPVASACAALIGDGQAELSEFEQHPERVIGRLGDFTWPEPQPVAVAVSSYGRYPLDSLGLPAETLAELSERAAQLGVEGFGFDRADADAARAYGSLLEFKHDRHWVSEFITDPAFIADRIRVGLDEIEKRH